MTEEKEPENILNSTSDFTWKTFPFYGTTSIIVVNVLVFIAMLVDGVSFFEPSTEDMLRWGANFGPYTLKDEWWRLFTCEFLHFGIGHLLANMVSLIYVGFILEALVGTIRFVTVYLLATVAAALLSLWWNPYVVGAGASGAVLAMYGMMLMFSIVARKTFAPGELNGFFLWAVIVIAINLLMGIEDGIDNSAHLGGIFYGMFAALVFYPSYRKKESISITLLNDVVLVVISVGFFWFSYHQLPKGLAYYYDKMEAYEVNQDMAIDVVKQFENDTTAYENREYYIDRFTKDGLYRWERNIFSLSELNNLPEHYGTRVELLMKYSLLRKETCEVIIKSLQENSGYPNDELTVLYASIDSVVAEINRITFIIDNGYEPELDTLLEPLGIKLKDIEVD